VRQPIYYMTKVKTSEYSTQGRANCDKLTKLGLGHLAKEMPEIKFAMVDVLHGGPDGKSGSLITYEAQDRKEGERTLKKFGYYEDEQTWEEVDKEKGLWIGFNTKSPPTAMDLARTSSTGGYPVPLSVEGKWNVPVIRRIDGSSDLAHDIKLNPYKEILKKEYLDIWERTGKAFDWLLEGAASDDFTNEMAIILGLDGLALNYRVGPYEQNALGILDSSTWFSVLCCMLDHEQMRLILDAEKKRRDTTQALLASSSPGQEDDTPVTARAEANSF